MNPVDRLAAVARVEAVLARLLDHPLSREELQDFEDQLARAEAHLEQLGAVARRERADVEALEGWVQATMLALVGALQATREKEQREYDEALAAVLRHGEQTRRMREELESLPPMPPVPPVQVCAALANLHPDDLGRFPLDLGGLRTRAVQIAAHHHLLDEAADALDSGDSKALEALTSASLMALDRTDPQDLAATQPVRSSPRVRLLAVLRRLKAQVEEQQAELTRELFDCLREGFVSNAPSAGGTADA